MINSYDKLAKQNRNLQKIYSDNKLLINKMAEKISILPEFRGFTNEDIINHFKWLIKKEEENDTTKINS